MFERYTEPARRVIFFARYEASQYGSATIETEHLLLALIREDKFLLRKFFPDSTSVESIRELINSQIEIREKKSTSVQLQLSDACKRILAHTAEEAEQLMHGQIGTGHILLGILREDSCGAERVLKGLGLELKAAREEMLKSPPLSTENLAGGTLRSFFQHSAIPQNPLPAAGVVPDADTAKRIAEAVWLPHVSTAPGEPIVVLNAVLMYGVWIVTGSHTSGNTRTTLAAFIQKEDAKILRIHQDKSEVQS